MVKCGTELRSEAPLSSKLYRKPTRHSEQRLALLPARQCNLCERVGAAITGKHFTRHASRFTLAAVADAAVVAGVVVGCYGE